MTSGVYKITCTKNGKVYFGISSNIEKRWESHWHAIKKPKYRSAKIMNEDYVKFGKESFSFEIVHKCDSTLYLMYESVLIQLFETWKPENGYNTEKGFLNLKHLTISEFLDYERRNKPQKENDKK